MIRTLALAVALACASTPALAQQRAIETCGVFQRSSDISVTYIPVPGYSVLLSPPPFSIPPGQQVDAIVCDRTSIFLGPNDHRVITDLNVPFFIRNNGRVAVLEIADRQLRLRFTEGQPTPEEQAALGPALDHALAEMDRMPRFQAPAPATTQPAPPPQ